MKYLSGFSNSHVNIPDHRVYSLTRAWDVFNRLNPNYPFPNTSWGTCPCGSTAGQAWEAQVSQGAYYLTDGNAVIDPQGAAGTFQQGLPTSLLRGEMQVRANWSVRASGGALHPVSLVAQRVDNNNYVRAELVEKNNHKLDLSIVRVVNGVSTTLATASNIGTYQLGDWWYLRFRFDGGSYSARAWRRGDIQPVCSAGDTDCYLPSADPVPSVWQVSAQTSSWNGGTIAIRSSNSGSNARPVVRFESFWAQTIGFSIQLFVRPSLEQTTTGKIELWGKGDAGGADNQEYLLRYFTEMNGDPRDKRLLFYVFDWTGGHGTGQGINACNPDGTSPEPLCPPDPIDMVKLNRWNHLVMRWDPGDALDPRAGVWFYVNGQLGNRYPRPGGWYNGSAHCVGAISPQGLPDDLPGVPSEQCPGNNECEVKQTLMSCSTASDCISKSIGNACVSNLCRCSASSDCGGNSCTNGFCKRTCWNVFPMSGNANLNVGTKNGIQWFNGAFDELAVFSKALSHDQVTVLYEHSL
jgi:hypothetical protein